MDRLGSQIDELQSFPAGGYCNRARCCCHLSYFGGDTGGWIASCLGKARTLVSCGTVANRQGVITTNCKLCCVQMIEHKLLCSLELSTRSHHDLLALAHYMHTIMLLSIGMVLCAPQVERWTTGMWGCWAARLHGQRASRQVGVGHGDPPALMSEGCTLWPCHAGQCTAGWTLIVSCAIDADTLSILCALCPLDDEAFLYLLDGLDSPSRTVVTSSPADSAGTAAEPGSGVCDTLGAFSCTGLPYCGSHSSSGDRGAAAEHAAAGDGGGGGGLGRRSDNGSGSGAGSGAGGSGSGGTGSGNGGGGDSGGRGSNRSQTEGIFHVNGECFFTLEHLIQV